MSSPALVRTISAPITADPEWGADPGLTPPTDGVTLAPQTKSALFLFRAFDSDGVEISLEDMELDITVVAELSVVDPRIPSGGVSKPVFREMDVVGGNNALIEAKKIAIESDLPSNAVRLFPRMRGAPVNPPAAMDTLQIYGGTY